MGRSLTIAHTPDADDAFMFAGLFLGAVRLPGVKIKWVLDDIERLNHRAQREELDVVAVSAGAYPLIAGRYRILSAGASVGRNYGPVLVASGSNPHPCPSPEIGRGNERLDLQGARVATPGEHTTAAMLLHLYARRFRPVPTSFEKVVPMVRNGRADLGLVIHEVQITFSRHGLTKVLDMGRRWMNEQGLPIPLGLEVVKRNLGLPFARRMDRALKESILWAGRHREEALRHALRHGRGVDRKVLDRFVRMYVNKDTLDLGPEGRNALKILFKKAREAGLLSSSPRVDVIENSSHFPGLQQVVW